jgi:hypothetical protein
MKVSVGDYVRYKRLYDKEEGIAKIYGSRKNTQCETLDVYFSDSDHLTWLEIYEDYIIGVLNKVILQCKS